MGSDGRLGYAELASFRRAERRLETGRWNMISSLGRVRTAVRARSLVRLASAFVLGSLGLLFMSADSFAAETSYPIVCKGGGDIKLRFDVVGGKWGLDIGFKRSAYAGNSGKLVAGECAWIDRAMLSTEPAVLHVDSASKWSVADVSLSVKDRKWNSVGLMASPANTAIASKVTQLFQDAAVADKAFYVHAYANGDISLWVTKIGP